MSRGSRFPGRLLLAACAAALFLGCGPKGVKLDGKIVDNGQPFKPPGGGSLSLSFTGGEGGKDVYGADIHPDGAFTVGGPKGDGVPPGKYKIAVSYAGGTDPASLQQSAKYNERFKSLNGQEVDVEEGKTITIDVGTGAVK